eukprot:2838167-Pyramimonas_sp.AAC.1
MARGGLGCAILRQGGERGLDGPELRDRLLDLLTLDLGAGPPLRIAVQLRHRAQRQVDLICNLLARAGTEARTAARRNE